MGQFHFSYSGELLFFVGGYPLPLDTRGNSRLGMTSGMLQSFPMGLPYPPTPCFLQENHHFNIQ